MGLLWDEFLPDARAGNVAGTFYYFDTEAQITVITDSALTDSYGTVGLGDWLNEDFKNDTGVALGVADLGFSQFVPRHICNGEIWAVGIVPVEVPTQEGWFPKARVPVGFHVVRYNYKDMMPETLKMNLQHDTYTP